jgi:hypothetical protein
MPQPSAGLNHLERLDAAFLLLKTTLSDFLTSFDTLQLPDFCDVESIIIDLVRGISGDAHAVVIQPRHRQDRWRLAQQLHHAAFCVPPLTKVPAFCR